MELWELVRQVSERYGRRLEQHKRTQAKEGDLGEVTVQQFQYLQAIRKNSAPTIGSLSAYFGVRSPTATVIVARLEEKGFLKRSPNLRDRRSHRLMLTPKAHKVFDVQEAAFKALGEDIKSALPRGELELYARLTEKVCLAFEQWEK